MKIINEIPGKLNQYTLTDPCPGCGSQVTEIEYSSDPFLWSYGTMEEFTFSPCGCKISTEKAQGWHILRFETKASYNKEVVTREIRKGNA